MSPMRKAGRAELCSTERGIARRARVATERAVGLTGPLFNSAYRKLETVPFDLISAMNGTAFEAA